MLFIVVVAAFRGAGAQISGLDRLAEVVADVVYKLCDGASDGGVKVSLIVSCGKGGNNVPI